LGESCVPAGVGNARMRHVIKPAILVGFII
jgi:hypothetical protein